MTKKTRRRRMSLALAIVIGMRRSWLSSLMLRRVMWLRKRSLVE
jgi:hypothetical protein